MRTMILLSLWLNLLVLIPICLGLLLDAGWIRSAFGDRTPARSILLAVYLAIALLSALLLFLPQPLVVSVLLVFQVVYKLLTPLTLRTLRHPVVLSNLAIAAVHSTTLWITWRNAW